MPHFVLLVPPVSPIEGAAHYYWVLLKWLHEFKETQTTVFLPEHYLHVGPDNSRWEFSDWSVQFHEYEAKDPKSTDAKLVHYDDRLTHWLPGKAPLDRFVSYVTQDSLRLYGYFLEAFSCLKAQHSEIVAVTWLNCPSMRRAATEAGCPLVFNEIGPLRKPYYTQCAYWDMSGVNGDTEVDVRWRRERDTFREWLDTRGEASVNEMLESTLISDVAREAFHSSTIGYAVGISLQVETDSNALAFSEGWNNLSLLEFASRSCADQAPLIRHHPNGKALYAGVVDLGQSPLRFLGSIQELWTINSSLGIEAVLWRKKVRFFGSTPIQPYFDESYEASLSFRIWFFLNYLIPYSLLFSADYYAWRLSGPSVADIAEKHLRSFQKQRHDGQSDYNRRPAEIENRTLDIRTPNAFLNELFDLRQRCSGQDTCIADLQSHIEHLHTLISDRDLWRGKRDGWVRERDQRGTERNRLTEERDEKIHSLEICDIEQEENLQKLNAEFSARARELIDNKAVLDRTLTEIEALRNELLKGRETLKIERREQEGLNAECLRLNARVAMETSLRKKAENEALALGAKLRALELRHDRLHRAMRMMTMYLQGKLIAFRCTTRHVIARLYKYY